MVADTGESLHLKEIVVFILLLCVITRKRVSIIKMWPAILMTLYKQAASHLCLNPQSVSKFVLHREQK